MEQIKLDIVPVGVAPVAHASQFDNGRQIRFNLFNQGTPYTLTGAETVTMVVNGEEENITNTSDNYVIWDVAEEDCEEVGVIGCELRIVLGSMLIGSKNFFLEVEMDPYDGKNIRIVTVGPADICTFETTLPEPYQSVIVDILATGGNGTPDNPNPINGYTSANITRCGVNLWGHNDVTIGSASYVINNEDVYLPAGTYVIQWKFSGTTGAKSGRIDDADENAIATFSGAVSVGLNSEIITIPTGKTGVKFKLYSAAIGTYSDFEISSGSATPDYHPYTGNTYTIAFAQTVYGGVLDVKRGKLKVDRAYIRLTSALGYLYGNTAGNIWFSVTNPYIPSTTSEVGIVSSSHFKSVSQSGMVPNDDCVCKTTGNNIVWFKSTTEGWTSVNDFKTWLDTQEQANTPVELVYKLATPFDIDLTPEVIEAIVGANNVFADCGKTEVKYLKAGG